MPKGEENHGYRHSPAGADEIPGLIVLVPSEDNPTQDPYTPEEGDLLVGQESPLGFARYPFDPADSSSTRNVLAGDQGDTKPTWKAMFDGTNPAAVRAPTEAASPGTSLIAAHRDHGHSLTTAETDTSLRLAPDGSGGVEWGTGGGAGGPIYIPFGSEAADGHQYINDSGGDSFGQFGYVTRSVNPADYSASPLRVVLEVILQSNGVQYAQARLYNVTTSAYVTDSLIQTLSTTPVRLRSPLLTLASGNNVYRIERGGPDDTEATCYDAVLIIGGGELDAGSDNPSAGVGDDVPNEIRNHPAQFPAPVDNAQPGWWLETDANATLTEVDVAGEGITEKYERCLKLVVATAPSSAYQLFTYADEPRLKSGKTYSVAFDVWTVGGISCTLSLVSSVPTTNTSSATTAAAWTTVKVEAIALDGTTLKVQMNSAVGTSYWKPLGLVEGSSAPTVELRGRDVRHKIITATEILTADTQGDTGFTDEDVTTETSPLAVRLYGTIEMFEGTSGQDFSVHMRYNGSAEAESQATVRAAIRGADAKLARTPFDINLDENQIFEWSLNADAGASTINVFSLHALAYDEWE